MRHARFALPTLALALACSSVASAAGGHEVIQEKLTIAAQKAKIPTYTRKMANGVNRVYVNPNAGAHYDAMEKVFPKGSAVLQIMHHGAPDAFHTKAIFELNLVHTQYRPGMNWRFRYWGDRLLPTRSKNYSAMIYLTPVEAQNMRDRLNKAFDEQGPEETAGANWEHGHIKGALGIPHLNCIATWSEMPIGEKGEKLFQLLGLNQSYSGNPRGFQLALEHSANERVFGIGVYGPKVETFGKNPDANVTFVD